MNCVSLPKYDRGTLKSQGKLRRVHTMKVMRIESKLVRIVCVHTECALTAIRIECTFSQSTSIGGLKSV